MSEVRNVFETGGEHEVKEWWNAWDPTIEEILAWINSVMESTTWQGDDTTWVDFDTVLKTKGNNTTWVDFGTVLEIIWEWWALWHDWYYRERDQ